MSARVSSFIGMIIIAGFLIAAWSSHARGGMLVAMLGLLVLAPVFLLLLGRFLRGDK
ncbi:MAG TPA: hypothetical protein PK080_00345 [Hyphomonadaceae bacterium]|nr:hypothetical protein [Hyphomonadaceae bacterium]